MKKKLLFAAFAMFCSVGTFAINVGDYVYSHTAKYKVTGENLVKNGCFCVTEGANMPSTPEAIAIFQGAKILYSPGKASNAGGVATSGLEMSQNSMRHKWTAEEVDQRLRTIMADIHAACLKYGTEEDGYINYVKGANIAGFMKVANAMVEQGLV